MKKLYIAVFSLLLFSCSEYKENSALERCATEMFVKKEYFYGNNILYKDDKNFKAADLQYKRSEDERKRIKEILESNKSDYKKFLRNWREKNPKPEYVSRDDKEKRSKYDVDYKAWQIKRSAFFNSEAMKENKMVGVEFKNKLDKSWEEYAEFRFKRNNIIKSVSKKKLSRMSLKKKRELNGFLDTFLNCENALKRTKKTFMLKYGN